MAGRLRDWQRFRGNSAWGCGALISVMLVLPLLRAAARQDKTIVDSPGTVGVHQHAGLFINHGLWASIPALIAAVIGRKLRWVNIAAVVLVVLLAIVCEVYVSQSSSWTF